MNTDIDNLKAAAVGANNDRLRFENSKAKLIEAQHEAIKGTEACLDFKQLSTWDECEAKRKTALALYAAYKKEQDDEH